MQGISFCHGVIAWLVSGLHVAMIARKTRLREGRYSLALREGSVYLKKNLGAIRLITFVLVSSCYNLI